LFGASLARCVLNGANLREVDLGWANLQGAILSSARLSLANLRDAVLADADLRAVNLTDTENLTSQQIDRAHGDRATKLPENVERPLHWLKVVEEV
jgi:uncharacterized protein YjbI with pentapeptide repeats